MIVCLFESTGSKTSDEPTSTVAPNASCASRCSDAAANNVTDNWTCGCSDDCLLKNSCCIDYAAFCLTGRTQIELILFPICHFPPNHVVVVVVVIIFGFV